MSCTNNNNIENTIDNIKPLLILEDNKLNNDLDKEFNKLKNINNPKEIPYFSFKGKTFYVKHCNIYDGDTFSVIFSYNDEIIKYRCRCYGYDTAEMKQSKTNENRNAEKELAIKAKNRLDELLNKHYTKLVKIQCLDFDKYGRILVNVWNMVDTKSINEIMIEEGYGKVYTGGTKEEW